MEGALITGLFIGFLLVITMGTVSGLGCDVCPEGCQCSTVGSFRGSLRCNNLGLMSVMQCGDQPIGEADFSHNDIEVIQWGDLPPIASSHCLINLENNMIRQSTGELSIESCSFLTVGLGHNSLISLPTDFLRMGGLNQSAGQNVSLTIHMGNNAIEEVLAGAINVSDSLPVFNTRIDLSSNRIQYIHPEAFHVSSSVFDIVLNLMHNRITSISSIGVFGLLVYHPRAEVDLRDNLIRGISEADEEALADLDLSRPGFSVNLQNNPLHCDCNMRWVAYGNSSLWAAVERAIERPIDDFDYETEGCNPPRCVDPSDLRGYIVGTLSPENFTCGPRLDPAANLTIVTYPGAPFTLRCPVIDTKPPVELYSWTYTPRLSKSYHFPGWQAQYVEETRTNEMFIEAIPWEGVIQCRPIYSDSTLSIDITVFFDSNYPGNTEASPSSSASPNPIASNTKLTEERGGAMFETCAAPKSDGSLPLAVLCVVLMILAVTATT